MSVETHNYSKVEQSPDRRRAVFEMTREVLRRYAAAEGVGERRDVIDHAERTVHKLGSVDGGRFPEDMYIAAYLHDLVDRLLNTTSAKHTEPRARAAAHALLEILTHPDLSSDRTEYIGSILADTVHTDIASSKHRVDMATRAGNGSGEVPDDIIRMMSERYEGSVSDEAWSKTEPPLDFQHMEQFIHGTNVEALIIKANELLDNIEHPSSQRESAQFQDYLEAMAFYVVLLEAMGMDGNTSMIRGSARKLSLRGQGKTEVVEEAEARAARLSAIGFHYFTQKLFGVDDEHFVLHEAVSPDAGTGEYPVHLGNFVVRKADGSLAAGNYRGKSDGEWAYKKDKKGVNPSDEVGFMVISNTTEESVRQFVDFIEQRLPHLEINENYLVEGVEKKPIYAQGSREFVAAIETELRRRGLKDIPYQLVAQSKGQAKAKGYRQYEAAKLYLQMDGDDGADEKIFTEVQFVTKEERRRSRLEEIAHIVYKHIRFKDLPAKRVKRIMAEAKEALGVMYDRMQHLDANSLRVNQRSIERRDELYAALEAQLPYIFSGEE